MVEGALFGSRGAGLRDTAEVELPPDVSSNSDGDGATRHGSLELVDALSDVSERFDLSDTLALVIGARSVGTGVWVG